jgi:biotin-dependent carboxylase-like uncharacterized protein
VGYRRIGLPRSGALDILALAAANVLVGNPKGTAALELLFGGLAMRVVGGPIRIALAGAELPLSVDGRLVPSHASILAHSGQLISVGRARHGVCGVLAVEGGIDVPEVLGSRSLHARSKLGGYKGRFLMLGDRIPVSRADPLREELSLPPLGIDATRVVRVVPGPQADFFSSDAIADMLECQFKVTEECDRMAYRLDGPRIRQRRQVNLVSDGVFEGAVQVAASGYPIVMLADHQTTGGYPKIAAVITPDIRVLANRQPGQSVSFSMISIEEAQAAFRRARASIDALAARARKCHVSGIDMTGGLVIEALADSVVNAVDATTWGWV